MSLLIEPLINGSLSLEDAWDDFCLDNEGAWFMHTMDFYRYASILRPEANTQPAYFVVKRGKEILAACPYATETLALTNDERRVLSIGFDFLPSPVLRDGLSGTEKKKVLAFLWDEMDRRAKTSGVVRGGFREPVLVPRILNPTVTPTSELTGKDFFDASLTTRVVDLRLTKKELWSKVRASYHSLIHRMSEKFHFNFYDDKTMEPRHFVAYCDLHHRAAGRVTRPLESFLMQEKWIQKGRGYLALATDSGRAVAAVYVVAYKNKSLFGSACEDPGLGNSPLGHFIQWNVMMVLKERGYSHYELGWQFPQPSFFYEPTPAEKDIGFFKRGFGGVNLPFFRSVKYYDEEFFRSDFNQKVERLAVALFGQNKGALKV